MKMGAKAKFSHFKICFFFFFSIIYYGTRNHTSTNLLNHLTALVTTNIAQYLILFLFLILKKGGKRQMKNKW